jgi:hypothetical protein
MFDEHTLATILRQNPRDLRKNRWEPANNRGEVRGHA